MLGASGATWAGGIHSEYFDDEHNSFGCAPMLEVVIIAGDRLVAKISPPSCRNMSSPFSVAHGGGLGSALLRNRGYLGGTRQPAKYARGTLVGVVELRI